MFYTTINEGIFSKILGLKKYRCILSEDELNEIANATIEITKVGVKKAGNKVNKFKKYFKYFGPDSTDKYCIDRFDDSISYIKAGVDGTFAEMRFDEALGIDDYYEWIDNLGEYEYRNYIKYNLYVRKVFNEAIMKEYNRYKNKELLKKFTINFYYAEDDQEEIYKVNTKVNKEYYEEID